MLRVSEEVRDWMDLEYEVPLRYDERTSQFVTSRILPTGRGHQVRYTFVKTASDQIICIMEEIWEDKDGKSRKMIPFVAPMAYNSPCIVEAFERIVTGDIAVDECRFVHRYSKAKSARK